MPAGIRAIDCDIHPDLPSMVVHEVGHNFGIGYKWHDYVDLKQEYPNYLKECGLPLPQYASGNCVMSYKANNYDFEFSTDALTQIRTYGTI